MIELALNYGKDFWTEARLATVPSKTAAKARKFYNIVPKRIDLKRGRAAITPESRKGYIPYEPAACEDVLLLGFVYSTTTNPTKGGLCYQGGLRRRQLEQPNPGRVVYTLDNKRFGLPVHMAESQPGRKPI